MVNSNLIFAGIEGGATHSNIVLVDGNGQTLASGEGPSTNHWLDGMDECCKRIKRLVDDAKTEAGIPSSSVLNGLGLCLSGCEQESSNQEFERMLREQYPNLSETIFIASDTIGSLSSACKEGGVNLISGTGSNCLLMNPDGKTHQCGGWGHMLGDEGGAYWIAARAVKLIFDEDDNILEPPHSTDVLRQLIFQHFELSDRFEMLPHCYSNFQKQKYASLTAKISRAASGGDKMSIQIMNDAGYALGRHISAISRHINPDLFNTARGLEVVCSGSVFKSWPLLKEGFLRGIQRHSPKDVHIPKYTLLRLEVTSAFGAIYKAALKYGYDLPRDYGKNCTSFFFCESQEEIPSNGEQSNQNQNGFHSNGQSKMNGQKASTKNGHFSDGNQNGAQIDVRSNGHAVLIEK